MVAAALILAMAARGESRRVWQCGTCGNVPSNVTGPTVTPLLDYTGICTKDDSPTLGRLSDGSWVRKSGSATLYQGAQAVLTGQCLVRGCSGPNCVTFFTQDRIFNYPAVYLSYYDPNLNPPGANFPLSWQGTPPSPRQSIDSSVANTTNGPVGRYPNIEGLWTFRFWALTTQTNCNIQPTVHPEKTLAINVEICKPEWNIDGTPKRDLHPPPGPITIVVPSSMSGILMPLADAVGDWEAKTGTTIHIAFNGDCLPTDGRCVVLDQTYSGVGCLDTGGATYNQSGEYTSPTSTNLMSNWAQAAPSNLRSDLAHELGHFFGLGDRDDSSCSCGATIMGPAPSQTCNDPNPYPSGCALGPTASDQRTLPRSSNREVCGW